MKPKTSCHQARSSKFQIQYSKLFMGVDHKGGSPLSGVSRATDAIRWRMGFLFNLHLRRTKCSVYLTNVLFLPTKSSHQNVFDKVVI